MLREKITLFVKENNAKLYIAKNKGLNGYIKNLLPIIGVLEGFDIKEKKASDIPKIILDNLEIGIKSYGIMGDDLFDEFLLKTNDDRLFVLNTYDWYDEKAMYKRPALVLLNKTGDWTEFKKNSNIAIRREYEKTITKYLNSKAIEKNIEFKIQSYDGGLEEVVFESNKIGCVEIVYSGATQNQFGLKPVEVIRFSDIVLIGVKEKEKSLFEIEYDRICDRVINPTDSYTSKLLKNKNELIKKIGSEFGEYIQEMYLKKNLVGEFLDVVYSTMIGLASEKKSWIEVEQEIKKRW